MTGTNDGDPDSEDTDRKQAVRWEQVAQRHYDPDGCGELATAIVFAVADADGVPPVEVKSPPLYESVDVAAIESAFFGSRTRPHSGGRPGTVEFRYADYIVNVRSNGWIQIYEPSASRQT